MLKQIKKLEIFSAIFIMIAGTILHFVYEWSNYNHLIGIFSAVNESTWEHLKLLFFPMLLTTIFGYFGAKESIPNYLCCKTKGLLLAMSFIVIFFYTYTGILGTDYAFLDISSFYVAVILGEAYTYKQIKNNINCNPLLAIITLITLTIMFILFTFNPPHINIFKDPITHKYGIIKK